MQLPGVLFPLKVSSVLIFFNKIVNGTNYHVMLSDYVLPQLQQHPDYNSLIFMQGGAPSHYANRVRNLLNTLPDG